MNNIGWCEGGLQLAVIATKNIGENDLNPRIKYIMVRLKNETEKLYRRGDIIQDSIWNKSSILLD